MLCTQCGNDNPSGNKFCGDCGTKLEAAPPPSVHEPELKVEGKSRPVVRSADLRDPTDPGRIVVPANGRNATHVPTDEPVAFAESPAAHEVGPALDAPLAYSGAEQVSATPDSSSTGVATEVPPRRRDLSVHGPSLLGLNDDDSSPTVDDGDSGTTDYSYLYEDEGGGRTVNWRLMLALLVLIGFGGVLAYMWSQGKSWNTVIVRGNASATQPKDAPVVAKQEPTTPGAPEIAVGQTQAPVPASTPQSDGAADNAAKNNKPADASATNNATSPNKAAAGNQQNAVVDKNAAADKAQAPTSSDAKTASSKPEPGNGGADVNAGDKNAAENADAKDAKSADNADDEEDAEPAAPANTKSAAVAAKSKGKASAAKSGRAADTASEDLAQVHRADALLKAHSCNQAVDLLREAALHGNATARSRLGGLYATGTCVPLDRAEAYNWFTLAKDAGARYSWIDHNRNMLWAEMTERERERVMRR